MKATRMAGVVLASGAVLAVGYAAAPAQIVVEDDAAADDPCADEPLQIRVVTDVAADDEPDEPETEDADDDADDDDSDDDNAPPASPVPISAVECGDPFDGPPVSNLRGTYQAVIVVRDGVVVDVQAVVAGTSAPESIAVNTMAIPQFRERVLAAQSWDVDAVSGASYTSPAFLESLEGAFAEAGL